LIDNDVIEEKNLPYLFENSKEYISIPKVEVLKDILIKISSIDILTCYYTYPNEDTLGLEDVYMIDCRDNPSENSIFKLKVNIDGYYGIINRGPSDISVTRSSRYTINNSKYYSLLFASLITQYIFGDLELKNNKTIIDLRKGELHGILP